MRNTKGQFMLGHPSPRGVQGVYIEPHHIIPIRSYWSKLFDTNNGITLCRPCHKETMWKEDKFVEKYSAILSKA